MGKIYYILNVRNGNGVWEKREGISIKNENFMLYGEKQGEKYVVTEGYSGVAVGYGKNKNDALAFLGRTIEAYTVNCIREKLVKIMDEHGTSPLFDKVERG